MPGATWLAVYDRVGVVWMTVQCATDAATPEVRDGLLELCRQFASHITLG